MRILLTGATGFFGSHIAEALCGGDYELLLVKRSTSDTGRCSGLPCSAKWVDIDAGGFEETVLKFSPEAVINAAWGGVVSSERNDWGRQIKNLAFQQQLLDISLKAGVKRFISIGSQAEYGITHGCVKESDAANPITAYGAVKLAASDILRSFCTVNNISWYWFRLFSVFGEGEGDGWLIPSVVNTLVKGEDIDATAGEQQYAYLYVANAAEIVKAALTTAESSGIYNISSSETVTIRELISKIKGFVNSAAKVNFGAVPYREGQSMFVAGDTSKTDKIYKPDVSCFDKELKRVVDYYIDRYSGTGVSL